MNIEVNNRLFLVGGATSGFGRSVALTLVDEKAKIIAVARERKPLEELKKTDPDQIETVSGDITNSKVIEKIMSHIGERNLDGIFINAGGPPAKSFAETSLEDWDTAYETLLKWKVILLKLILPKFLSQHYGRILFCESASVKQPIPNLVLSNSLRLAVVGLAKSLAEEVAGTGITVNVLAPGYHATPAMERLFEKKSKLEGISIDEARVKFEKEIKTGHLGNPDQFASLAAWLLSPVSGYITGQTISVDGGLIRSVFG